MYIYIGLTPRYIDICIYIYIYIYAHTFSVASYIKNMHAIICVYRQRTNVKRAHSSRWLRRRMRAWATATRSFYLGRRWRWRRSLLTYGQ